jgi:hypothetical protein
VEPKTLEVVSNQSKVTGGCACVVVDLICGHFPHKNNYWKPLKIRRGLSWL